MTPNALAKKLLGILISDRERHLLRIDDYLHGRHDDPYMPDTADAEYRLLAKRAVSNWMPLLVSTPAQQLFVDSFRPGTEPSEDEKPGRNAADKHWQRSRLDAKQHPIHRGAIGYGHAFSIPEKTKKGVITRGLSPLKTSAVFEDPANDIDPYAVLTVVNFAEGKKRGKGYMWDQKYIYLVSWEVGPDKVTAQRLKAHGNSECPVTRFAANVDLDGRTVGVVEPLIPVQDRINQTIFDLLVAQTYGSFKVRYATGMAPPMQMRPELADDDEPATGDNIIGWVPKLDESGQPVPKNIDLNAKRFLFADDPEARFGSLDGTSLDGYISSVEMSVKHLSATSQTPPHYLLGQIANLAAEALDAAETSLSRMCDELKSKFGESWERNDRMAAELEDDEKRANDFESEAIWRDMGNRSLAQAADALGKLRQNVEAPVEALWEMIPGMTEQKRLEWISMREEETAAAKLAGALTRATTTPKGLQPQQVATDRPPVRDR